MPTYKYQCQECHSDFDLFQSMSENAFKRYNCMKCNKDTVVKRLIVGGSGMIFKGSGFYLTDYTDYGKKNTKNKKDVISKKNENTKGKKGKE